MFKKKEKKEVKKVKKPSTWNIFTWQIDEWLEQQFLTPEHAEKGIQYSRCLQGAPLPAQGPCSAGPSSAPAGAQQAFPYLSVCVLSPGSRHSAEPRCGSETPTSHTAPLGSEQGQLRARINHSTTGSSGTGAMGTLTSLLPRVLPAQHQDSAFLLEFEILPF